MPLLWHPDELVSPPGDNAMHACLGDQEFLRFLDGELDAEADARVVGHVEDCADCQAHLERLTRGISTGDERDPIETVRTDAVATVDLPATEDLVGTDADRESPGGPGSADSDGSGVVERDESAARGVG
jgi:hypothetical protein